MEETFLSRKVVFFAFLTVETFVNFPLFETAVSAFQLKVTLSTFTEFTFTFFGAVLSTDFTVTVYEDDDWIDTVDVMKVLLQEKKKRLKLHFQNPYRKKCKHTGL